MTSSRLPGARCRRLLLAAAAGVAISLAPQAQAAVVGNTVAVDFSGGSTTFTLDGGASYTLTGTGDFFNPVAVSTAGTALVNSLGLPFYDPPQPTSYFTNRGTVVIGPGMLFTAFPAPTTIPFSVNVTFIGLAFTTAAGTNYGFARFDGTTLLAYGYETTPGTAIIAGAPFTAPIPQAVPEPVSFALLAAGLLGLGAARGGRRRQARGQAATAP